MRFNPGFDSADSYGKGKEISYAVREYENYVNRLVRRASIKANKEMTRLVPMKQLLREAQIPNYPFDYVRAYFREVESRVGSANSEEELNTLLTEVEAYKLKVSDFLQAIFDSRKERVMSMIETRKEIFSTGN